MAFRFMDDIITAIKWCGEFWQFYQGSRVEFSLSGVLGDTKFDGTETSRYVFEYVNEHYPVSCSGSFEDFEEVFQPHAPDEEGPLPPEGIKFDTNKNRLELMPSSGIEVIGKVFTYGAEKYDTHNWAKGMCWSRLLGAALRHLYAYLKGEDKDPESGLSHLGHAGACIMMLAAYQEEGLGTDDRRKLLAS